MAGIKSRVPTTGVWWDLNTCPVPATINPSHVRRCIESALQKFNGGPCPLTIFAVGNLEYISPNLLEAISSSGILIRHAPFRAVSVTSLLNLWGHINPPPAKIMLISDDNAWFNSFIAKSGYTVLRAFLKYPSPTLKYPYAQKGDWLHCVKEWYWEDLLVENNKLGDVVKSFLVKENHHQHAFFCTLCQIPSESCKTFSLHLKGEGHKEKLFRFVPSDQRYTPPIPNFFCNLCKYPGYDGLNLLIHFNSDEHIHEQNKFLMKLRMERSVQDKAQGEEMGSCSRREEDLLNKASKR